ncbi:MAG: carotenoid oxygenase family protein [Solirubrobacteraceae bacterium]
MSNTIPEKMWLMGPMKPMRFEANVDDCVVSDGEIPVEINGGFYRVGGTWKRPTVQGLTGAFTLDGMVQALVFREGRVDFRNRWIRTPKYLAEERAGRAVFEWTDGAFGDWRAYGWGEVIRNEYTHGVPQGTNNVNVFPFAGQVLASGEQGSPPIALDPITLETKGFVPWSTQLSQGMHQPACFGDAAFTVHPKWDAGTGELYGWTYRDGKPYTTLHWVSPDGTVKSRDLWDAPYASLMHDMWLTPDYVVLPHQPLTVDLERIEKGLAFTGWDPTLPISLAVIPRHDIDAPIRWITADIEPEYILHTMSGNQQGNKILLDAPIYDRPPFPFEDQVEFGTDYVPMASGQLGRWTIDLDKGTAKTERLDDRAAEFPKVDERYYGRDYTWGFMLAGENLWSMKTVVRRNVKTGSETSWRIADPETPVSVFEPTFVPRTPDAPEGDGYLIVPVSRFMENTSAFQLFDTDRVDSGPIATIELPFQIGWTPHGHWMDFRSGELAMGREAIMESAALP